MRLVTPVISDVVVHLSRVPDCVYEERNSVLVERHSIFDCYKILVLIHFPAGNRHNFPCCTVDDFPPFLRVVYIVGDNLFSVISVEKINGHCIFGCYIMFRHKKHLLAFIHMLLCKFVVSPCDKISCIDLGVQCFRSGVKLCSITVTKSVRAPAVQHFFCLV